MREFLDSRFAQLIPDLEGWFETAAVKRAAAARERVTEHLNQAVRRLREAPDFAALAGVLADAAAPFASAAAVFRVQNGKVYGERASGVADDVAARLAALEFPLWAAAAFAQALESGDPVVALSAAGEISAGVMELFGHTPGERVCILPVLENGRPVGLLYGWGEAEAAPLELLAQAAGMALSARPAPPQAAELVGIAAAATAATAPAIPAPAGPAAPDWAALAPAERDAHRSAQRFARVQAAEMRLYRREAVTAGRAARDLYGALREAIDKARETYRQRFLPSPGMPDYLHEELLHTLANDDPALLGANYPGPLV